MGQSEQTARSIVVWGGKIASLVSFIFITVLFVVFEGAIVHFLDKLAGFWGASFIIAAVFIIITFVAIYIYDRGERKHDYEIVKRIRVWLVKQEQKRPKTSNLIKKSLPFGFIVATETIGPLFTSIIIRITTRISKLKLNILIIIGSLIFSFTWVAIYIGAIDLVKQIF